MHHDLKHRIQGDAGQTGGAPLSLKFRVARSFLLPSPECRRLVELADVRETDRILEPSAGTGAIPQAIRDAVPGRSVTPELHAGLVSHLQARFGGPDLVRGFSRIPSGSPVYPNHHESAV
jgi:hypothetical protein